MPIEYRGNGFYIEIRYREKGHNKPHVHAIEKGTDKSVSIGIEDAKPIIGKISTKKQKEAIRIVEKMREYFMTKWKEVNSDV